MYGSKDLLFNYDNIKDKEEIIICFDIIDYLTLYELGYRNICSKSTKGNGFVANYYDDLQKHKSIKLIFGGDISNTTFNGIIKRIGIEIVKYKRLESFSTINHAVVAGIDVNKEIKESIFVKIKSLTRLEDISFETTKQETMRFGQENGALSGLDWILDGVRLSTFNLLIGRDNEGKTSVAQQIMCNLIEQGHGVFLYDGESNQATLKRKFYLRLVGNDKNALIKKRINIRPIMYPKPPVVSALEEWHRNKLIVRGS
jgi:midasin (ATPase involved in ribosome maturation)